MASQVPVAARAPVRPSRSTTAPRKRWRGVMRPGDAGRGCASLGTEPELDRRGRARRDRDAAGRDQRGKRCEEREDDDKRPKIIAIPPSTASTLARRTRARDTGADAISSGASSPDTASQARPPPVAPPP